MLNINDFFKGRNFDWEIIILCPSRTQDRYELSLPKPRLPIRSHEGGIKCTFVS
jgi:hypothetical protein